METFSALLAICAGNSPVTGEYPTQRPVTRNFDVYIDLRLYKRLNKQSWGWWFERLSCPLWRHCNGCQLDEPPGFSSNQQMNTIFVYIPLLILPMSICYAFFWNKITTTTTNKQSVISWWSQTPKSSCDFIVTNDKYIFIEWYNRIHLTAVATVYTNFICKASHVPDIRRFCKIKC